MRSRRSSEHGAGHGLSLAALVLTSIALFVGLALFLSHQQRTLVARAVSETIEAPVRPIADVASAVRASKLVTVEIDTSVALSRGDSSWRGDVVASLTVPVRLHYGVDLSGLDAASVGVSPSTRLWVVRVPPPTRIATEVFEEKQSPQIEVGWLRLRSRAGEYYLGQARKDAASAARDLTLRPEDAQHVRDLSREQVEGLLRSILGPEAKVKVIFNDAP